MAIRRNARFQRYLKALPAAARAQIKTALAAGAAEIVAAQKQLCPVRTGKLRDSIKATPGNENLPAYAALRSKRPVDRRDPELAVIISAGNRGVRYAHLVEFGTAGHEETLHRGNATQTIHHPGAHAEPFFYPGFRVRRNGAKSKVKKAIVKAIRESYT